LFVDVFLPPVVFVVPVLLEVVFEYLRSVLYRAPVPLVLVDPVVPPVVLLDPVPVIDELCCVFDRDVDPLVPLVLLDPPE
jgi:hypothetical protein